MTMNPYAWSLVGSALVAAVVGAYVWWYRKTTSVRAFPFLMLALSWWSFTYGMELAGTDLKTIRLWSVIQYPAIAVSPVFWLIFTLQYAGKARGLSRWIPALLFVVPLNTVILNSTNDLHHLYYRSISLDQGGAFVMQALTPGPAYWLHVVYSYLCLLAGTLVLLFVRVTSSHHYRRQAGIMLLGASIPFAVNLFYLTGIRPFGHLDMTPFAFTMTGIIVALGLFHYQLFDVLPLARTVLLENLKDGIIVVDASGRVVEMNSAAKREAGLNERPSIGRPVSHVLANQPALAGLFEDNADVQQEVPAQSSGRILDARFSTLRGKGDEQIGGLLVLRDITAAKKAEEELRKGNERLELLLHALPQAILVIDARTHRILDANPQACILIGLPADRIAGRVCHEFICPWAEGNCPITDGGKSVDRSESVLFAAGGEEIPVLKTVLAVEVEGKEWLIESISDISELKQAERERVEKERLQALVETAGAVCHEMNQPLMGISGYGELCLMEIPEDHQAYSQVQKILEQVRRMGDITRKLMNITSYKTKGYLEGKIIDIDSSSNEKDSEVSF